MRGFRTSQHPSEEHSAGVRRPHLAGRESEHRRGLCCSAHPAGHPDRRVLRAERRSRGALSKQSARPSEISLHLARLLTRDDMLEFCRCRPSPAKMPDATEAEGGPSSRQPVVGRGLQLRNLEQRQGLRTTSPGQGSGEPHGADDGRGTRAAGQLRCDHRNRQLRRRLIVLPGGVGFS